MTQENKDVKEKSLFDLPLSQEQQGVLNRINEYFINNKMGYIKVPTGWGKTFLSLHLMKGFYESRKVILFLVSRNNQLLSQTFYNDKRRTAKLFPNSIILSSEHTKIGVEELKQVINNKDSGIIIFASLQTILSKRNEEIKDILIKTSDWVVIDEIHNFIHNRGNNLINDIDKNAHAQIFGMTATPFQGIIGNVKFVDDISGDMREIYSKTLPQCIIDGQLSELSYMIIRSHQNILEIFDFDKGLSVLDKDELCLNCSTIEKITLVIQRTYLAKKVYDEKIKSQNTKTLIFCAPVRNIEDDEKKVNAFHSKLCSAIFNNELKDKFDPSISFNNYSQLGQFKDAVYLSSELRKEEQKAILEAFRTLDKPPFILCTVGMLIEGFDFPDLENLILLRPTLSMRLFEQQVGRVTRLPLESMKKSGNIFEIADDIDSLYDNFKEEVFNEKRIERIQMLQPENRIEELFTEGNSIEAINTEKIQISEINFKGIVEEFQEKAVEIPPINLRVKYFYKLLLFVEKKDYGALEKEKLELMKMSIGFKIFNLDDAKEISRIVSLLERLEHDASTDDRLSSTCRECKPPLFCEVKWLLKLRALTYLKYLNPSLDISEKENMMEILGFNRDYNEIDNYRMECLKNGYGSGYGRMDVSSLIKSLEFANSLRFQYTKKQIISIMGIRPFEYDIYWASCFTMDCPEIRELFESKEWDCEVRKYIRGR